MIQSEAQQPTLVDEWWAPESTIFNGECRPRRVLAEGNGHVIYSDGGRRTKEVTQKQFENWVKKFGCIRDPYRNRSH